MTYDVYADGFPPVGVDALVARKMGIDTYHENVTYLRRDCPLLRAEGFQALSKVAVRAGTRTILAVLNVVDDPRLLDRLELGLSDEVLAQLAIGEGAPVQVGHAEPPPSAPALRRKISGERLTRAELAAIVRDIAARRYSKIELAAFVVATYRLEFDRDEVLDLTAAMVEAGRRIDWRNVDHGGPVVDKHCIGGIPGNRTSMVIVPIVAAYAEQAGILMPKTSSRAITSPSGTADTMGCLAQVELPVRATGRGRACASRMHCLGRARQPLACRRRTDLGFAPAFSRRPGADGCVHPLEENCGGIDAPAARHPARADRQGARSCGRAAAAQSVRIRGAAPRPGA